jgi:hypothetical protein
MLCLTFFKLSTEVVDLLLQASLPAGNDQMIIALTEKSQVVVVRRIVAVIFELLLVGL